MTLLRPAADAPGTLPPRRELCARRQEVPGEAHAAVPEAPALPHRGREHCQGAVQALVPRRVCLCAQEGSFSQGPRGHQGEHQGAPVLPKGRLQGGGGGEEAAGRRGSASGLSGTSADASRIFRFPSRSQFKPPPPQPPLFLPFRSLLLQFGRSVPFGFKGNPNRNSNRSLNLAQGRWWWLFSKL
nr:PREDICTED: uncharacterized protein LOC100554320 [Anolis carolinensis]|eukprot:XP_016853624.1 PREDICTED: uncharacterized protein LOC100554320 [Anolis carolinensis]